MKQLFFNQAYSENFHVLDYFKEILIEHNLESIILYKGEIEYGTDYFFCSEFGSVGLKCESECGNDCIIRGKLMYEPRNGKSGRCRHSKNCYARGEKYILTKDGKLKKEDL